MLMLMMISICCIPHIVVPRTFSSLPLNKLDLHTRPPTPAKFKANSFPKPDIPSSADHTRKSYRARNRAMYICSTDE